MNIELEAGSVVMCTQVPKSDVHSQVQFIITQIKVRHGFHRNWNSPVIQQHEILHTFSQGIISTAQRGEQQVKPWMVLPKLSDQ